MPAKILFSIIVTLVSFIGISYQYLICHTLGQFSQNEGLNQSITLGFYLLSMGIGAACAERHFTRNAISKIFMIELLVAVVGILMVPIIYLTHGFINIFLAVGTSDIFYGLKALLVFQVITVFIGFLTGFEIPLLMKISDNDKKLNMSNSKILAFSYLGTLISSVVSTTNVLFKNDFVSSGILIGMLSMFAGSLVFATNIKEIKKKYALLIFVPIAVAFFTAQYKDRITQLFLKEYYVNIKIPEISFANMSTVFKFISTVQDVERYVTEYQIVDILPDTFMSQYDRENNFTLYLNNQVQFGKKNYDMYHETMVPGSVNIMDSAPEHVLILGGGDGFIAAELKKIKSVKTVTQVEIDPQMIELAKNHEVLRAMNKDVYLDSPVKIVYDDAFSFIQKTKDTYDAVFIDFPFPTSYDLSKLYSVEFYRTLRKIINPGGYFVFDAPVLLAHDGDKKLKSKRPQDIIFSTLNAANMSNIYVYGLLESFYLVSLDQRKLQIHYDKLPADLKNKTLVNLFSLNETLENTEISKEHVNSIFKPQDFTGK